MRSKKGSIDSLLEGIGRAAQEREYNIAADLRLLRSQYGYTSRKNYLKLVDSLITKYESEEAAEVHAALVARARAGDVEAIRLWQQSRTGTGSGSEVVIQDDIG